MTKRKPYFDLLIVLLAAVGLFLFFLIGPCSQRTCATKTMTLSAHIPTGVPSSQALPCDSAKKEAAVLAPRTAQSRVEEHVMTGGNQGYIIRNGYYVYFGIRTIIREEFSSGSR